jgi:choline-sulfatase
MRTSIKTLRKGLLLFFLFLSNLLWTQEKPNVLFIMTDQQSFDMMGHMGKKGLNTPNLDKLASRGYSFTRTYVTNPVCMPSRFAIMTGHYSSTIGVKQNIRSHSEKRLSEILDQYALGKIFKDAGYRTLYSGKTHLYGERGVARYGFELNNDNPYEEPVLYAEKVFASEVQNNSKNPFFLFLSFMNPHDICYKAGADKRFPENLAPANVEETIRFLSYRDSIPQDVFNKQIPPEPHNLMHLEGITPDMVVMANQGENWDDDQWDLYRWMYNRLTESVDKLIGRVLNKLEEYGLQDNTIVVFTSDHGEMNGAHKLIMKNVMFEEAQRVPFIFAGKGILKNKIDTNTLVCNGLDFIPTICDLTGVKIPDGLQGISLKKVLTSNEKSWINRKYLVTESYNSYQITDGKYKLTVYELPDNPEFLVDLNRDPGELVNYANAKDYTETKKRLEKKLYEELSDRNLLPLRTDRTSQKMKSDDNKIRSILGEKGKPKL